MTTDTASAFDALQLSLVRGSASDTNLLLDALMYDPGSVESYSTFYRALVKSKLDPTELLTTAASLTLQTDKHYLMYVGLALRFGANPNTYVMGTFDIDGVATEIPVHLAKHLWDMTPRSAEESSLADQSDVFTGTDHPILDILALLMLSGLDLTSTVTTGDLLIDNGIDATAFISTRPDFGYPLIETFQNDDQLGVLVYDYLHEYEVSRGNLQLAYGHNSDRDLKLLAYAFHLDLPELLTISNLHADPDNYRKLIFFQDVESFKNLLPSLHQLGILTANGTDIGNLILRWVVEYYALDIMMLLLQSGLRINQVVRRLTINRAKLACEPYPAQCQLLNRMLVEYSRSGYHFDQEEIAEIVTYSPITADAIASSLPAIPNQNRTPIPSKIETIITRKAIQPASPPRRLLITDRDLPSVGAGTIDDRSGNTPYCRNESSLSQPIEDYSVVDRVTYSDGQSTWCFTSENYQQLLDTGLNPWARNPDGNLGVPIPSVVLTEIAEKFDAIKCNRLLGSDEEILANRDVEELYRLAEEYSVPRERFYALTARDFQVLADVMFDPRSRVIVDQSSPILAVRDFARAIVQRIPYEQERLGTLLAQFIDR